MVGQEFAAQDASVHVEVDFSGGDRFVAKHLLDGPEVRSPFEQMGGETVPQRMRRHFVGNAGCRRQIPDNVEDHDSRQSRPATVQEQDIAIAGLDRSPGPLIEIFANQIDSHWRERRKPLLRAFSLYQHEPVVEREPRNPQPAQFRHSKPAAVERLDYSIVAQRLILVPVYGRYHGVDLLRAKHVGQLPAPLGHLYQLGRIPLDHPANFQIAEKSPDPGYKSAQRRRTQSHLTEIAQQLVQMILSHVGQFQTAHLEP